MKRTVYRFITSLCLLLASSALPTGKENYVRVISGEYTFYSDDTQSRAECRRLALDGARTEALAREFGTFVSQTVLMQQQQQNGNADNYFATLSATEVKGEWLGDLEEPEYTYSVDDEGHLIVTCHVRGRARALSNKAVDFEALALRNGSDKRNSDTDFRDGDDMRLYFLAPVDGYVAVYLVGVDRQVYSLLPYMDDDDGRMPVKHGREYVFFDASRKYDGAGTVDELYLNTDRPQELNQLYVVFSPKPFNRAIAKAGDTQAEPPSLGFEDFSRWLTRVRHNDPEMGLRVINLRISKN